MTICKTEGKRFSVTLCDSVGTLTEVIGLGVVPGQRTVSFRALMVSLKYGPPTVSSEHVVDVRRLGPPQGVMQIGYLTLCLEKSIHYIDQATVLPMTGSLGIPGWAIVGGAAAKTTRDGFPQERDRRRTLGATCDASAFQTSLQVPALGLFQLSTDKCAVTSSQLLQAGGSFPLGLTLASSFP